MVLLGAWFWRGFQSAIFYYVSCAPCTKYAYQRKRNKRKRIADREAAAYDAAHAGGQLHVPSSSTSNPYEQPTPFSTNIHWREEMQMGPAMAGRGKKKAGNANTDGERSRALTAAGSIDSAGASSQDTTLRPDSTSGAAVDQGLGNNTKFEGEGWNLKGYQRPDEGLWGLDDAISGKRANGREGISTSDFYAAGRNPSVNSLHPPVVSSKPRSKEEIRWMLQPPPSAMVMEGKAPPSRRGRSGSGASSGRASSRRSGGASRKGLAPKVVVMHGAELGQERITEIKAAPPPSSSRFGRLDAVARVQGPDRSTDGKQTRGNGWASSSDDDGESDDTPPHTFTAIKTPPSRRKSRPAPILTTPSPGTKKKRKNKASRAVPEGMSGAFNTPGHYAQAPLKNVANFPNVAPVKTTEPDSDADEDADEVAQIDTMDFVTPTSTMSAPGASRFDRRMSSP